MRTKLTITLLNLLIIMKTVLKSLPLFLALFGLCIGAPAKADTVSAMCEYYPNGDHLPEVRMPCLGVSEPGLCRYRLARRHNQRIYPNEPRAKNIRR